MHLEKEKHILGYIKYITWAMLLDSRAVHTTSSFKTVHHLLTFGSIQTQEGI